MTPRPGALLIVGATGQVGRALRARYPDARALGRTELDITDGAAVRGFDWSGVGTVVNAAAYTDVDGAQTGEGRLAAWRANAAGAGDLAAAAVRHGFTLVHLSSDYVFDGTCEPHTEAEAFSPLGVYGQSKAAGDVAVRVVPRHYLVRTSWVIGDGRNFVRTMISLGRKGVSPSVVADQTGRPSFAAEIARAIEHLLRSGAEYGTYHVSNGGAVASWAEVARAVFAAGRFGCEVHEISTREYLADKPTAAPRPLRSALDLGKLRASGFEPVDWRADLERYVAKELTQ